jgi:alpha-amylase
MFRSLFTAARPGGRARWLSLGAATAGVLLAGGQAAVAVPSAGATTPAAGAATAAGDRGTVRDVSANLFQWNWRSVARECTTVLGPAGYGSVQVAPPQDSLKRTALGNGSTTVLHPWWEVYQPVDYRLTSRMGTEAQFRAMVATCRKAGVKVIVDTVINHMTGQGNLSYGGVSYTKYAYAGLYRPSDFHAYPTDCPVPPAAGSSDREGNIADFNDYRQVFRCELVGLSDLRTESSYVRRTLAAYLNKLIGYGVSGFRIDAAKHIGQTDLAAIEGLLHRTADGTRPYIALEVMPGGPGRLSPWAFRSVGNLLGFDYANQIHDAFKSYNSPPNDGNIGDLKIFGTDSGLLPSGKELVFVENHDTERNGSTLSYKDRNNTIANEFMLAWPHGTPQVYASFAWATPDDSPPATAGGLVTDTVCDNTTWVCVDRYTGVRNMVGFHNYVGAAPVRNWYDDGVNLVAFSRGTRGFFSTNNEPTAKTVTVRTGLPGGTYCDIIHGSVRADRTCSGPTVTVGRNGSATITVRSYDSVAFTARDRIS